VAPLDSILSLIAEVARQLDVLLPRVGGAAPSFAGIYGHRNMPPELATGPIYTLF
jgi:hypothetical protein